MLADMSDTDLELLARYARRHAEDAFAEIVRRHLGLVYSAALRQVRSPQLAEEVAQSVFTDLARNAARLKPDTILTAWLYQVTRRAAIDVVRREASRQLREQIATEMNAMNATAADWTHIEPLLDEAMHALDETDRAAVLLRYFENKSLREVGATLGTSENAAQKRLARAVERLREFFAKRGVTVGTSGLVVVISTNAVLVAPAGLSAAITTAAIAGTAITTTALAAATKTIAMTTLQKTLITTALAAAIGTGLYQARQTAHARADRQMLRQQHAEQSQQSQRAQEDAAAHLAAQADEIERLKNGSTELIRLRAEVTRLRTAEQELTRLRTTGTRPANPPAAPPPAEELTRDSWFDAGFTTPQAALRTRGWAVLNGNLDRFADSVFITDATRKAFEEQMKRMAAASQDAERTKVFLEQAMQKKYAIEEGLLTRLRGENIGKEYTGSPNNLPPPTRSSWKWKR